MSVTPGLVVDFVRRRLLSESGLPSKITLSVGSGSPSAQASCWVEKVNASLETSTEGAFLATLVMPRTLRFCASADPARPKTRVVAMKSTDVRRMSYTSNDRLEQGIVQETRGEYCIHL